MSEPALFAQSNQPAHFKYNFASDPASDPALFANLISLPTQSTNLHLTLLYLLELIGLPILQAN